MNFIKFKPENDFEVIRKGKKAQIGEVRQWKDGSYKKESEGKWIPLNYHDSMMVHDVNQNRDWANHQIADSLKSNPRHFNNGRLTNLGAKKYINQLKSEDQSGYEASKEDVDQERLRVHKRHGIDNIDRKILNHVHKNPGRYDEDMLNEIKSNPKHHTGHNMTAHGEAAFIHNLRNDDMRGYNSLRESFGGKAK